MPPKVAKESMEGNIMLQYCWHFQQQTSPMYINLKALLLNVQV